MNLVSGVATVSSPNWTYLFRNHRENCVLRCPPPEQIFHDGVFVYCDKTDMLRSIIPRIDTALDSLAAMPPVGLKELLPAENAKLGVRKHRQAFPGEKCRRQADIPQKNPTEHFTRVFSGGGGEDWRPPQKISYGCFQGVDHV